MLRDCLVPVATQPPHQGQGYGPLASPVTQVMGRCYPPPLPPQHDASLGPQFSLSVK